MAVTQMTTPRTSVLPKPLGNRATNLLAAEWTKLRSLRSTYWTMLAATVITIGLGTMVCAIYVAQYADVSLKDKATFNAASFSLTGGVLAQLAIAVLGVLVITGEYGSGTIRTTFAAVPQRLGVLAAKAAVFTAITLAVTTTAAFIAFFIGQAILSTEGINVGIGAPGALRTVVGTGLYFAVLGLISLGIGTLIRKTAGAITAVVGMIFVLPTLASLLPGSLDAVQKFLPTNAGQAIITGGKASDNVTLLSPWVGFGVFCLYAIVILGAGAYTLVRRDA
jgi:ABC-type transport system involved in multi-copper enzyme maturation permease subunit